MEIKIRTYQELIKDLKMPKVDGWNLCDGDEASSIITCDGIPCDECMLGSSNMKAMHEAG